MDVFVTGGTGFIGAHTAKQLVERGHQLRCLVRDPAKARLVDGPGVTVVAGDVTDKPSLADGMRGCQWVVNLANLYEFWVPDRRAYTRVNVDGTRNVLTAAVEAGARKVVHVSTAAIWGNAPWPVNEASPLGPRCASEYARTKRAGDEVAWELFRQAGLPLVMVFPAAVLGPDDPKSSGRYVANVVRGAMPAQVMTNQVFPWVHVRDVAAGIVRTLETDGNVGERYILASENLTFGQINTIISEVAGVRLPRITFPDWLTLTGAFFATGLANLTKKPPMLDMAMDQMLIMRQGLQVDGGKAVRELGLTYTPIRKTLEEAVASLRC